MPEKGGESSERAELKRRDCQFFPGAKRFRSGTKRRGYIRYGNFPGKKTGV